MTQFSGWMALWCLFHATHGSTLLDRLCKLNKTLRGCEMREYIENNETQSLSSSSSWIHADQLTNDDKHFLRLARQSGDDPSCKKLKTEYDQVCFTPPPRQAFQETKEFCAAFVEMCPETLKTNLFTHLTQIEYDFSAYCKRERERFQFVCPKPFRFKTYAEQAVDFCIRYKERCPKERVPDEPVPFKKEDDTHIYIKEIAALCKNQYRAARTFCFHPELLKYPKYAIPCAIYKMNCIDIYSRVIYG